jgi:hypothetical protein
MWRLKKVDWIEVFFLAKDTKAKEMIPTKRPLSVFIRMLAAQVPERYRHVIRCFGLLAPRTKNETYAGLFLLLGQKRQPRPVRLSWRDSLLKYSGVDPLLTAVVK